ncbi:MAG: LysR family transcriptional regulator [Propionibacteriaceae bacterium]|nr:LysR family transcriptional regulator [Propionibacteriaceae bacterium]
MSLDPRRVLILKDVIEATSISGAARALGWTQPAVTHHIGTLERSVGMPLLLRRTTGVIPTQAGKALLAHADAIASHLAAAEAELEEMRLCKAGTVRVAAFPSALATLIPHAMTRIHKDSGLKIRLTEAEPDEAMKLLHDDDVDVAVVFSYSDTQPTDISESFDRWTIAMDPVALLLPPTHPLAHKEDLHLTDLADDAWVAGCPRCREHLVSMAHRAGFEPRIDHETDDYVVVQSLVSQGLAVSVLPMVALAAYRNEDVVVRDAPELTGRRIDALFRPGADRVPSIAAVLGALTNDAV